jgi:hypothetical protein
MLPPDVRRPHPRFADQAAAIGNDRWHVVGMRRLLSAIRRESE